MSYTTNKGVYFPLKRMTRDGYNSPDTSAVHLLFKEMILDIKVFGAKKGKYYRIEWMGLGTTAWGTPNWELLMSEYDIDTYATNSMSSKKDLIKLFANEFGRAPNLNGIDSQTMYSTDGKYALSIECDYSQLSAMNFTGQSISMTQLSDINSGYTDIIDPSCYIYTVSGSDNYMRYNGIDPLNPILEVFGRFESDIYRFQFSKKTINMLFEMYDVHKIQSRFDSCYPFDINKVPGQRPVYIIANGLTDWVGPYVVKAVNNGDSNPKVIFTGGSHSTDNNSTSGTPTAVTDSIEIFVDGKRVITSSKEGSFKKLEVIVRNRIMSYNTISTGRYTHIEVRRYTIVGTKIDVEVTFQPLENLKLYTYYGLQADIHYYDDIHYVSGKHGGDQPTGIDTDSGEKRNYYCDHAVAHRRNTVQACDEYLEMKMDNTVGLGQRHSVDDTQATVFATTSNKMYNRLCGYWGNTKEMDLYPNYDYSWKGYWHFKTYY